MSVTRRDFLKTAACGTAAVTALAAANVAIADDAAKAPVFDDYDFFAESRVVLEDIPEDQIAGTYDFDVVVIGGGNSGTVCAMAAGTLGAGKVALLQNAFACISGGWGGSGLVVEQSDRLGLARYKQKWNEQNLFRSDQHIVDNILYRSGDAIELIHSIATDECGLQPSRDEITTLDYGEDSKVAARILEYGPKPKGYVDAMNAMCTVADNHNVEVFFGMPGVKLIQDEAGRVVAAIGKSLDDDKYYRFNAAKGVVLATGSFHCNQAMLERYCTDIVGFDSKVQGYFGDGHLMAMLAGGFMRNGAYSKMVHDNDSPMQNIPFFAVNENGERFMDEDVNNQHVNNLLKNQPNKGYWTSVFDGDYMDQVKAWGKKPSDEAGMQKYMPGTPENLAMGVFGLESHTYKADTLEDLAAQLGIPADNLIASVNRYNELVEAGLDEDFGKATMYLAPIKNPPFWGVRRHQRLSAILGGVDVDKYMRVITKAGEPIEGLFAVGNVAGVPCGSCEWLQIQGGGSNCNAVAGGYTAAKYLAGLADW